MKQLLLTYCKYNLWANQTLINYIQSIEQDIIDTPLESSFPDLRKTIYHIWDAQVIWLSRLQGASPLTWPSMEYGEGFSGFDLYFLRQCEDFIQFISTRSESFFESVSYYKTINGTEQQTRNGEIVLHSMNHSTYHRGQIITMLHNLGFHTLPATDYIVFNRLIEDGNLTM